MPPLKVVFDTNIFVMAVGMPGGYIDAWLDAATPPGNVLHIYTSPAILSEVQDKLEQKMGLSPVTAREYVARLRDIATVVVPTQSVTVITRDPDDNRILECAAACRADLIISADKDVLRLKKYHDTQIYHPTNLKYIFQTMYPQG